MKIYNYHPETKEYLGESEARKSPLEKDVYLIPACAVDFAPTLEKGKITYFEKGSWVNKDIPQPEAQKEPSLEDNFNLKKESLKQSRSTILSSSKLSIVGTEFDLHASDLPILQGRVDRLANNTDTLGWNDSQGNRFQLNKDNFESLIRHIQVNDISTWDLYSEKLEELKAIKNSEDLEDSEKLELIKNFNTDLT